MSYEFIDNLTMADVAFDAHGETLEEMFRSAAEAVTATMVKELDSIDETIEKKIEVENADVDMLLFNFLQELIYYKDAEMLLLRTYKITITKQTTYHLTCVAKGEKLDMNKHELLVDVKAVTLHHFSVKHDKAWHARVILDV